MSGRPPTRDAPPFGRRLATLRKARGLSQEDLAKALDTTRANVTYYERQAANPTLDFIERCAEVLGVEVLELVSDSQGSKSKPGPKSKLQLQFEAISRLPRSDQKFFSQMIERFLSEQTAGSSS